MIFINLIYKNKNLPSIKMDFDKRRKATKTKQDKKYYNKIYNKKHTRKEINNLELAKSRIKIT